MKFCPNCGYQMDDTSVVCTNCGTSLVPPQVNNVPNYQHQANGYVAAAPVVAAPSAPLRQLPSNRGLIKAILLSIVTLGIYGLVLYYKLSDEVNITASKYDGKKTMNFALLFFLIGPLTCEIGTLVWFHKFSGRVGNELKRRGINYSFGAGSFWLWNVLGLLIIVGPFIYLHKLIKAVNLINADYNIKG